MDEHDSVITKVDAIFRELAGPRADSLRGNVHAREANDILGRALAEDCDEHKANELAFHLVDLNSDAAFLVAFMLFPERFTQEELRTAVDMLLIHVPAHILAAARLGGYEARDIFTDESET